MKLIILRLTINFGLPWWLSGKGPPAFKERQV